jgi:superfamily II DNA or RNA helicase
MTSERTLVSPGEMRAAFLELFEEDRDDLAVICAAPGLVPDGWEGQSAFARDPYAMLSVEHAAAHRAAMLRFFASDVDRLPMRIEWWNRVQAWLDSLRAGGPVFRYLPRRPIHTRAVSRVTASYLPGGPLIPSCQELDLQLLGSAHVKTRAWLEGLFADGEDISGDIERVLSDSWAGDMLSPEDLYLKILAEYFEPTLEEMDTGADENPVLEHLTDFQRSAYEAGKGILRRYGGVFLSDVVGLGKTYIAMAIMSWLERTYDERSVVVGPPAVQEQWRALGETFRVQVEFVSIGKLDELARYTGREVLVVDESHNFRNRSTLRYDAIQSWLRPDGIATRKVILLSATPQNNDPRDVQRQLELFPDVAAPLPFVGESLDDFFRRVQRGESSLSELLTHVLVRRTRRFIKDNYPNTTVVETDLDGSTRRVPLEFPQRVSGDEECLRYRIDEAYGGRLYQEVMTALRDLRYPLHTLFSFVRPEHQSDARLAAIRQAGSSVRGLYRVLLLKRLESSVEAFRISLERLQNRLARALNDLRNRGSISLSRASDPSELEDEDVSDADELDSSLFEATALAAALESDLSRVAALSAAVHKERGVDTKLLRLRRYLEARPPALHRTLIFTVFNDTAVYLHEQLGNAYGRIGYASGSSPNNHLTAQRFSPRALRARIAPEEQIDLLVSTDVLSEGVNLQDADTLINYDLHWNPVRLIQRAGRIDRIGSAHDEIHIASFMPERGLEANLGLETVLRRRIQEFLEVFGDDNAVLPSAELPDIAGAIAAFTGTAFVEAEAPDETDGMSRHFERLNTVRRNDPARYERLRSMRRGKRSVSLLDGPAMAAYRLGWHWAFYSWLSDGSGAALALPNDLRGLDGFYTHSKSAMAPSESYERFESLVTEGASDFGPQAELLRQQRMRPQLSRPEQYILRKLDEHALGLSALKRPAVDSVRAWVLAGQQRLRLQRMGRQWERIGLPASSVFQETWALFRRFPMRREDLGDVQLSGIVLGAGLKPPEKSAD